MQKLVKVVRGSYKGHEFQLILKYKNRKGRKIAQLKPLGDFFKNKKKIKVPYTSLNVFKER